MRTTPSQVKNIIRRGLRSLVDAELDSLQSSQVWTFFGSMCAYCGVLLDKNKREGHLDHLVSSSAGGSNHLSNRVLSCGSCNGDQKRELPWNEFLRLKNPDAIAYRERHCRILKWIETAGKPNFESTQLDLVARETKRVIQVFDDACATIRSTLKSRSRL